jgi:hypothetical protein
MNCLKCNTTFFWSKKYGSFFCLKCNTWEVDSCTDKDCAFCEGRPTTPIEMPYENIEICIKCTFDEIYYNALAKFNDENKINTKADKYCVTYTSDVSDVHGNRIGNLGGKSFYFSSMIDIIPRIAADFSCNRYDIEIHLNGDYELLAILKTNSLNTILATIREIF